MEMPMRTKARREGARQERRILYLDNASTSFPKPDAMWDAMRWFDQAVHASPGRTDGGMADAANEVIEGARSRVADLFGVGQPRQIAFTHNATHALNIVIKGFLRPDDHVVLTAAEHNSVLRPLDGLRRAGKITFSVVQPDGESGCVLVSDVAQAMRDNTRLVIANHASNVTGAVASIEAIGRVAREHGAAFLVDAAQTGGCRDVNVGRCQIDFLAFTGHKAMLGPPGTGGLYARDETTLLPLYEGGTGMNSHSLHHPEGMPTRFEAGTVNYLGIAGLGGSLKSLKAGEGSADGQHERRLATACLQRLDEIHGVTTYGPRTPDRAPVISINLEGLYPGEVSHILEEEFGIVTRPGLQCAPLMHRAIGTYPLGTVRISIGHSTQEEDIEFLAASLDEIVRTRR